jgi:hypothetical protein
MVPAVVLDVQLFLMVPAVVLDVLAVRDGDSCP